jgi:hypothetical protein
MHLPELDVSMPRSRGDEMQTTPSNNFASIENTVLFGLVGGQAANH